MAKINPSMIMGLMNAKAEFERNHPKFAKMIGDIFTNHMVEEGSVIELTVTGADGTKVTGNMRVQQSDMELIRQLQSMGNRS